MSTRLMREHRHLWQEPDPARSFEACRESYHRDGVVCIRLSDIQDRCGWVAAKQLRQLGDQYFGKRKG